jgi:class 3 adenylate cyclase
VAGSLTGRVRVAGRRSARACGMLRCTRTRRAPLLCQFHDRRGIAGVMIAFRSDRHADNRGIGVIVAEVTPFAGGWDRSEAAVDVTAWLQNLGLERYARAFREHDIDLDILSDLTELDLEELGIASEDRKQLLCAIAQLSMSAPAATAEQRPRSGAQPSQVPERQRSEAERRQLTILFCEWVGAAELATRLDPENFGQVVGACRRCCVEVIERWDGHIGKDLGGGLLAYFGWPEAHEDDAERAVRAGLNLAERVAQLQTPEGKIVAARIGIQPRCAAAGARRAGQRRDQRSDASARARAVRAVHPGSGAS